MVEDRHDLRMPVVGAVAWLTGIAAHLVPGPAPVYAVLGVTGVAGWLLRRRLGASAARLAVAAVLVAAAVLTSTVLRHEHTARSPVADLAAHRAAVTLTATVGSDPRLTRGQWNDRVVVRVRAHRVTAEEASYQLGASVLVLAPPSWQEVEVGERLRIEGRLDTAEDDPDLAAILLARGDPQRIRAPDVWWQAAEAVRASLRESVVHRPDAQRSLVPALVVGDVSAMDEELRADFRTTGLTHLTAVSGTNLTLLLGFVLVVARAAGVRGRWLHLVALLGIVGFILLTRTEPSVLRAAAMGTVGLFAMGTDGRRRGMRALGVAVTVLLLVVPSLALSAGFALSVLATTGIVIFGPPITRSLSRWLPMVLAQAVAVPLAAQVAVTPVVAGLSGEVSLVAVFANVVVAPAVGPATVLGLTGALVGLGIGWAGRLCGTLAGWCVGWIVLVAETGARLPQASIGWGSGALALSGLVVLCVGLVAVAPWLARRRGLAIAVSVVLVLVVLDVPGRAVRWPGGWPSDWVLVACDVGQGDALAVATGRPGEAVVVDVGPDPEAVARCLDDLGVESVPLVVLSHLHADHVDGLPGVLDDRRVEAVEVSAVLDPPEAAAQVQQQLTAAGVPVDLATHGSVRRFGDLTLQVLWPEASAPTRGAGDGSTANDASVVLLVEVRGVRILLTGDIEPPGQRRLAAAWPDLRVDVLKVPHHGSRHQETGWLTSLRARLAVVTVGAENDYGHPAPDVLAALEAGGTTVARTDEDGGLAVVVTEDGRPALVTRN